LALVEPSWPSNGSRVDWGRSGARRSGIFLGHEVALLLLDPVKREQCPLRQSNQARDQRVCIPFGCFGPPKIPESGSFSYLPSSEREPFFPRSGDIPDPAGRGKSMLGAPPVDRKIVVVGWLSWPCGSGDGSRRTTSPSSKAHRVRHPGDERDDGRKASLPSPPCQVERHWPSVGEGKSLGKVFGGSRDP
jgi:hypothetical protein